MPWSPPRGDRGRDTVAVILAIGIATGLNLILVAVLWDAVRSDTPGLSENATQVVITAFSGIVGVLGGYIGGRAAERRDRDNLTQSGSPPVDRDA